MMAGVIPLKWIMRIGGIYDTRTGATVAAPSTTRISTVDGPIEVPRARSYENIPRWKADLRLISGWEEKKAKKKKNEAKAIKWEKRRKVIKELLHKIKEKLKE